MGRDRSSSRVNFLRCTHYPPVVCHIPSATAEKIVVSSCTVKIVTEITSTEGSPRLDVVTLGRRLRHARRARGLTLADVARQVGAAASALSLIENGRREPRLTLLQSLADALDTPIDDLLRSDPPSRRASLEIALERAQRDGSFTLGLPPLRPSPRVPTDVL